MAYFTVNTTTQDNNGNQSAKSTVVKAGSGVAVAPTVSFSFPQSLAVSQGNGDYPYWETGVFRAFALCQVVPTPSTYGTGRFLVQHYYHSGLWPNAPSRRFNNTFDSAATTLLQDYPLSTGSVAVVHGGGISPSGFCNQFDISGVRPALIISRHNFMAEPGARVFAEDCMLSAYHTDIQSSLQDVLRTLKVFQNGVPNGTTTWLTGTPVVPHPYHYCPIYENNTGYSISRCPVIAVIEEGTEVTIRGLFTVSGTLVSGLYCRLQDDIEPNMAIRFLGSSEWYIINEVSSQSELTIHDYGDNPQFSDTVADVVIFTTGLQTITVLPNMEGCNLWDIALSPRYNDGTLVMNPLVTYTAGVTGSVAPSGTLHYQWNVITEDPSTKELTSSGIADTTSNTLQVPYQTGVRKNVQVWAWGSLQPSCIHYTETGLLNLQVGTAAGQWTAMNFTCGYENTDSSTEKGLTIHPARDKVGWVQTLSGNQTSGVTTYIHHWSSYLHPLTTMVRDNNKWFNFKTEVVCPKGSLTDWPNRGPFVFTHENPGDEAHICWATYAGKISEETGDKLTGVEWHHWCRRKPDGSFIEMHTGKKSNACNPNEPKYVTYHSNYHMPMTYITERGGDGYHLILEDVRRIVDGGQWGAKNLTDNEGHHYTKAWLFGSGTHVDIQCLTIVGFNRTTNEITTREKIDSQLGFPGHQIVLAPWYHWRNGSDCDGYADIAKSRSWNLFSTSLLSVLSVGVEPGTNTQTSFSVPASGIFDMWVYDPLGSCISVMHYGVDRDRQDKYRHCWLPPTGRLIFPNVERKNLVVEYTTCTPTYTGNGKDANVHLEGCTVVWDQTYNISGTPILKKGNVGFLHKQLVYGGENSWQICSNQTYLDNYAFWAPNHKAWILNNAGEWIHRIFASTDITVTLGDKGLLLSQPIWEQAVPGLPTGCIPQIDPYYNNDTVNDTGNSSNPPDPGSTSGGSCVHEDEHVVLLVDGREILESIKNLQPGQLIKTSSGFCPIQNTYKYWKESCVYLVLANGFTLRITGDHPVATQKTELSDLSTWIQVQDLEIGDCLWTSEGFQSIVEIVDDVPSGAYHYDLHIQKTHDYLVNGILVHNAKRS